MVQGILDQSVFFGAEEAVYHNQLSKLWVTLRGFCSCQPSMPRDVRRRPARKPARRIRHNYSYEVKCSYNGRMNQARFISWLKEECAKQVSGRTLRLTMQAAQEAQGQVQLQHTLRHVHIVRVSWAWTMRSEHAQNAAESNPSIGPWGFSSDLPEAYRQRGSRWDSVKTPKPCFASSWRKETPSASRRSFRTISSTLNPKL